MMHRAIDRRDFARVIALGLGAVALPVLRTQSAKKIKIGVSTLAWNVNPNSTDTFEQALKDISELGYSGFETVSPMIEALDASGAMSRLMEKYHISHEGRLPRDERDRSGPPQG